MKEVKWADLREHYLTAVNKIFEKKRER
jgi:hypothetical protein